MSDFSDTLESMTELLPELAQTETRADAARTFTDDFYDAYQASRDGLNEDETTQLNAFLASSAPALAKPMTYLDFFLSERIENMLNTSFMDDEWLRICEMRSVLEGLRELYAPHLAMDTLMPADTKLDDMIRAKAESEAYQDPFQTPDNYPETHWWWALD